ncbi:MAG: hypothetical protein SGJ09_10740 [Phycisphaerae bacterium]|nr:hypothetical protein [Phycisphaerae bacterium]
MRGLQLCKLFVLHVPAVLAGATSTSLLAAPPEATVSISVDGGPTVTSAITGTTASNGNQHYVATYTGAGGAWTINCDVSADYMASPQAGLVGIITIQNLSQVTQTFNWGIDVPLCPTITGGSLVGGTSVLTLTTVGPGTLSCADGVAMLRAVGDGATVGLMYACPMNLGTTGSGTATVNGSFGTPLPADVGPTTIDVIGQRESFTLTSGDKLKIQFVFAFKDTLTWVEPACAGDLNGDGAIGGMDLTLLLFAWGNTDPCAGSIPEDIDGSGMVDGTDLSFMLNAWGPCDG